MQHSDAELLERYAIRDRTAQRVRANFIASLDGAATHEGRTAGLSNADDKKVFDLLRMMSDVVLVGAGTLRLEGYAELRLEEPAVLWRVRHGLPPQPTLAVVSAYPVGPQTPMQLAAALAGMGLVTFLTSIGAGGMLRAGLFSWFGSSLLEGEGLLIVSALIGLLVAAPFLHPRSRAAVLSVVNAKEEER